MAGIQEYLLYIEAYTQQAETFTRVISGNKLLEMGRVKDMILEKAVNECEEEPYDEAQSRLRLACLCTGMNHKLATQIENIILDLVITNVQREPSYSG